ncbi:MAG TPA: DEAD/DEAH box helicase [Nocardioides sp.]|nr:DEAD/DEAH box helicase [Nocardioides sp.]
MPARLSTLLARAGIEEPTPIQAATLPDAMAGRDVLGRGRTGSGKTYAFLLPVVARLAGGPRPRRGAPRALILAPTRELVGQIDAVLAPLAREMGLTSRTVFGGVGQQPQVNALRRGVDIVIACPGRLEDLMGQGHCVLDDVQVTVLDEADHMADLGFLPGVRRILRRTPRGTQRLLFSATLDKQVDALVREFLNTPVTHEADSPRSPVAEMSHHVLQVEREHRLPVLVDLASAPGRTVVFTRTKHGAKALARQLNRSGVSTVELHGNLSQGARTRNLDAFHSGRASTLVATDVAARGIHVDDVARVVHADLPAEHKSYLHRSGRTARAGNTGTVVTLITRDQVRAAKTLAKAAGITPTTTRIDATDHPVLRELAPGERVLSAAGPIEPAPAASAGRSAARASGNRRRRGGRGRPASSGQRSSRAPKATGQKASTGGVGRPRRSSARAASAGSAHSAAGFSAGRR